MTERLKQIWGGFERTTTRALTGRGVDHLVLHPRRDDAPRFDPSTSGDPAPAEVAFSALKTRLLDHGRRSARQNGGKDRAIDPVAAFEAEFAATSETTRDLIRALKATEDRVERPRRDYHAGAATARAPHKSFFGLFGNSGRRDRSKP